MLLVLGGLVSFLSVRLERKYEYFITVKIFTNVIITMEFIDNENLKTKVYKSRRKKNHIKRIKILKPTIIDYKKNNKMRLILEFF